MKAHPYIQLMDTGDLIGPEALAVMRSRGGQWAAYQNMAMDSASCGHIQFLKYGQGCTFQTPPVRMPDTEHGLGWKYLYVGIVNLDQATIEPLEVPDPPKQSREVTT